MSLRLCSVAPSSRIFCPVPRRRVGAIGNRQLLPQVLRRQRSRLVHQSVERSGVHDAPALLARPETQIDDVVGDFDHVGVVLDHDDGVALIPKLPKNRDEPLVVARVQPDGRLVEHVQRADERRPQRRREVDPLRFAARERGRQAIQREVVEPDVAQKRQPAANLLEHLVRDRRFLVRHLEAAEEGVRLADRQRRHPIDRAAGDAHVARLAPQPRAAAVGTGEIAAVPAEKHAHVHLVFLPIEPPEESADALVASSVAFDDEPPLVVGQLGPRHFQPDLVLAGRALQLRELRAIVRLAPRLDGALLDRLRLVGHHQIHVELDDVAEPVTGRAGAERVVEREEPRLRVFVGDAAFPAFEQLAELMHGTGAASPTGAGGWKLHGPGGAAAFEIGGLDGIGEPLAQVLATELHAIDDDLQRRPARERGRIDVVERHRAAVHEQAAETLAPERLDRRSDRRGPGVGFSGPEGGPVVADRVGDPGATRAARRLLRRPAAVSATATTGRSNPSSRRVPEGSAPSSRATTSAVSRTTSRPQFRQNVRPMRAYSSRM